MTNLPHNISRSAFRKGEYVLHTTHGAQRVIRTGTTWRTAGLLSLAGKGVWLVARTLKELGAKAEKKELGQ